MSQHLVFREHAIEHRTTNGQLSVELLRLNNDESLEYRDRLSTIVKELITAAVRMKNEPESANKLKLIATISKLCGVEVNRVRKLCKI